jgi:hypothetical protein
LASVSAASEGIVLQPFSFSASYNKELRLMKAIVTAAIAACLAASSIARADIIISEIMWNPNGSEGGAQEWIEITNTGGATVDLSGWVYGDSQDGQYSDPFLAGTSLSAGASAVIVGQSAAVFQSIWGAGVQVITYTGGPAGGIALANSASATNETVAIFDASNNLIDDVNYESNISGWPATDGSGVNGQTIYLLPTAFTSAANDIGANWAESVAGVDGAYTALTLNPGITNATLRDVASPGVAVFIPEPSTALLAAIAALGLLRRAP